MTTATATPLMTAEEFLEWVQLPENSNGWFELVEGKVIELPAPTKIHGVVAAKIAFILQLYVYQRRKGYVLSNDSGVILKRDPDTVRGPDVAVYEDATRFSELHPKYGEVPPRLAVEVLSPSDRPGKVSRKVNDYLSNEVDLVWVVSPEDRTVAVYSRVAAFRELCEQDEIDGGEVLPGFRCKIADFFYLPGEETAVPQPTPPATTS